MVETASFDDLVVAVRRIESSALPKTEFPEKIDATRVIEFSPTKMVDHGYQEILNDYSVLQKIISASKLDIFGPSETKRAPQQAMEIESKVKEITSEALETKMKLEEVSAPPPLEEFEGEGEAGAKPVSEKERVVEAPAKKPPAGISFESDFDKELAAEFKFEEEKKEGMPVEKERPAEEARVAPKTKPAEFEEYAGEKEEVVSPDFEFETETGKAEAEKEEAQKKESMFEKEAAKEKFEKPRPVFETPSQAPIAEEKPVAEETHPELKHAEPQVPPLLLQRSEEAGAQHFEKIEEHFKSEWGAGMSETDIRKKMVELTRELFKEKSTSRKEELKAQIVTLKSMLGKGEGAPSAVAVSAAPSVVPAAEGKAEGEEKEKLDRKARALAALRALKERRKGGAGAKEAPAVTGEVPPAAAKAGYSAGLLGTVLDTQRVELTSTKENVLSSFSSKIQEFKDQFNSSVAGLEEDERQEGRKKAYDKFIFSLTALKNQLPAFSTKFESFITQKHLAELEKLKGSVEKDDPKGAATVDARIGELKKAYSDEFANICDIISRNIDSVIDSIGPVVFAKEEKPTEEEREEVKEKAESAEKKAPKPKEKKPEKPERQEKLEAEDILREINGMDDGSLLYYLHSVDKDSYRQYERRHISKHEAIFKAKRLIAKERGMSATQLAKYFGKER